MLQTRRCRGAPTGPRIVGVPSSIANRAPNWDVPWPFHETVSTSPSIAGSKAVAGFVLRQVTVQRGCSLIGRANVR